MDAGAYRVNVFWSPLLAFLFCLLSLFYLLWDVLGAVFDWLGLPGLVCTAVNGIR